METKELHLVEREAKLGNQSFFYYAPDGDDTVVGTYAAIKEDDFKLEHIKEIEDGDIIVDIGCNVGLFSCLFAKVYSCARVYAFDPNPVACMCARINRCRNSITNLEIFNKAIGAENKKDVEFYTTKDEISASVEKKYTSQRDNMYKSDVVAFDEIFNNKLLGIDRIKYLKIDIEGGEFDVINYICDKHPELIDKIDYLHLEIHSYPYAEKLKEKTKVFFGDKWING